MVASGRGDQEVGSEVFMKVVVEALAYADTDEIAEFYEQQEAGAGIYFVRQLKALIRELEWTGGIHNKRKEFHIRRVRRFPISLYYKIIGEEIRVIAVTHAHRDPSWINKILRKR